MEAQELAISIVNKLCRNGYIAYYAGGWVRDLMLQHPSDDIDIATNAPVDVILDLFPRTILVGLNFGVVIVAMNGHQFEVSTFRKDIEYINGRKPERIEKATPQEDAFRRDFTINGMFYDPIENLLHDYVQGLEDLKKGIIRTIGDPQERFLEDRLRMIRAFRFAARFGFTIDQSTQDAIIENAPTLFPSVAIERVWQEFTKMSAYPNFDHALIEMQRLELLPVIFPALNRVHLNDLKNRVFPLSKYPKGYPTILFLLDLFPQTDWEELFSLCRYLKISIKEQDLLEFFYKSKVAIKENSWQLPDWVRFYARSESSLFLEVAMAHLLPETVNTFILEHEKRQIFLNNHIQRARQKRPLITSYELKREGVSQGIIMGQLLKLAEEYAIKENVENCSQIMTYLKQSSLWPK